MRTSVIVPLYNAESTALTAVRSVLEQSDTDLEVIVVDDGSSDGTARLIEKVDDPRLRLVRHTTNRGVSAARNTALAAATGEFVAFLDADDVWDTHFLRRMHAARGHADAVVGGRVVVLPDGSERSAHSARLGTMSGREAASAMMTGALTPFPWDKVIRRAAFAGLTYPTEIHRFEDQVVGVIALHRSADVVSIPDALIRYHVTAGSLTWGRVPQVEEALAALSFLERGLGDALGQREIRTAFAVCQTMFLMLTAQSAMRSADGRTAGVVLAECRARLSGRMIRASLTGRPVIGLGALLLRAAPGLYRRLFTVYVRRKYALG